MYAGIPPQQCGMLGQCSIQCVIESDGSVYPCDFYVLDSYNGGNLKEMSLVYIMQSTSIQNFLKEEKKNCRLCADCPFVNICNGNCKRMNTSYFEEGYRGYQEFLAYAYPSMLQTAKHLYG